MCKYKQIKKKPTVDNSNIERWMTQFFQMLNVSSKLDEIHAHKDKLFISLQKTMFA